ncbi:MAG: hypothetical protein H0W89_06465 [Candidatus Levybacteria bacterium]|nr:hypothetical protein [Candidatus Levybacteria bacterium]
MNLYTQLVSQIIKDQESIIGPVALEQARKVDGLEIIDINSIKINGDAKIVISALVEQYAILFGRASVEICKEAVLESKPQLPKEDLPEILR